MLIDIPGSLGIIFPLRVMNDCCTMRFDFAVVSLLTETLGVSICALPQKY